MSVSSSPSYSTRSGQIPSTGKHHKISQFADYTSNFRKIDIHTLNVEYVDALSPDEISVPYNLEDCFIPEELFVLDMYASDIRSIRSSDFDKLDNKVKTIIQLINLVLENDPLTQGTEESRTDTFVNRILERLNFGDFPLMVRLKPLFKFSVGPTKRISSELDFAVIKNSKVMLIDEDKHIRNAEPASAWGEYQIAGELIASANYNYSLSGKKEYRATLHGVRVVGLKFTFYKATITPEYLDSLWEGFPSLSVRIVRYPPRSNKIFPYLDYGDANERREIINMLIRIREEILYT